MKAVLFSLVNQKKLHWSIPDPAKAEGSKMKINTAFEAVFNQLKQQIKKELLS